MTRKYRLPIADRVAAKTEPCLVSGCWLWTDALNGNGYGRLGTASGELLAHRAAYMIHIGPIPDGLLILHRCDTPSCVNPAHLFLGTHADNMADMASKGRGNRSRLVAEIRAIAAREASGEWVNRRQEAVRLGLNTGTLSRHLGKKPNLKSDPRRLRVSDRPPQSRVRGKALFLPRAETRT